MQIYLKHRGTETKCEGMITIVIPIIHLSYFSTCRLQAGKASSMKPVILFHRCVCMCAKNSVQRKINVAIEQVLPGHNH